MVHCEIQGIGGRGRKEGGGRGRVLTCHLVQLFVTADVYVTCRWGGGGGGGGHRMYVTCRWGGAIGCM